jgi:hypothetical protein
MISTILIVVAIALIFLWLFDHSALSTKIKNLSSQLTDASTKISEANNRIELLSKYQHIIDVEAEVIRIRNIAHSEASEIIRSANTRAQEIVIETTRDMTRAKEEAKSIRAEARTVREAAKTYSETTKLKAEAVLEEAKGKANDIVAEAQKIINSAHKKAEDIAGDAYTAMRNAEDWKKTAEAMKNIIEGYGDKYLKPTYSLLDDLAEELGHTEAGEKLREARNRTRLMIESGVAAKCEYVEANRRDTAISFVLDAFNGKVDSILSKVKKDNYGTLQRMVVDAFRLVNNNGKAFRNAIITEDYLKARLEELNWAVIAQELKWQEQEEQRRIKEQIREEEKARRDYERAIREAQKEEDALKKLIERAQKEVAQATEAQKAEYELRLQSLEGRLKEAEEKNQRALSMAQQTKSGNVYIISNIGSFGEDVFKIGMTRRLEPLDRIRELGDASVPFEFDVHSMIYSEDAPRLERELHKKFLRLQINKVNPRKEFFRIQLTDIKEEVEKMGIEVKWTMAAEARQYKESLAIEEAIVHDAEKAKQWEQAQLLIDPVSIEEIEKEEV